MEDMVVYMNDHMCMYSCIYILRGHERYVYIIMSNMYYMLVYTHVNTYLSALYVNLCKCCIRACMCVYMCNCMCIIVLG